MKRSLIMGRSDNHLSHLPPIGSTQSIVFTWSHSIETLIICGDYMCSV